eukprot:4039909-Pyramimonas_sp.AAC.1
MHHSARGPRRSASQTFGERHFIIERRVVMLHRFLRCARGGTGICALHRAASSYVGTMRIRVTHMDYGLHGSFFRTQDGHSALFVLTWRAQAGRKGEDARASQCSILGAYDIRI